MILCEDGMHLLMAVFAGIGYLYGDAGLRNLLHESGVFAAGSVEKILSGRDFDRALYALKITDETLNRRFLLQFKKWCENNKLTILDQIMTCYYNPSSHFQQLAQRWTLLM